jgi:dTDP-4-amino-4,6-dideoxygalactose transaminase
MTVPVADPSRENRLFANELEDALRRVAASGTYVLGPEVAAFESEFAEFVGASFAVGVASGTDALTLALWAYDIGPGDEVLTVSHTAGATVAGIIRTGATPVLVDVDPMTLTLEPRALRQALTERARAVVPVHIYGGAAPLSPIREFARKHGLHVIEDCAQAHGTRVHAEHVGVGGDAGAFSFYPTKNLGGLGDGGAVVTSRPDIAEKLIWLRQYGWRTPQFSEGPGLNSRLDEVQAAVLRVKLRHLPDLLAARRDAASSYSECLGSEWLTLPQAHGGVEHSFHLYVIRTGQREALMDHLRGRGIGSAVHYPVPVHCQPGFAPHCVSHPMAETDRAATEVVSLPMFAAISKEAIERVTAAIDSFGPPKSAA